MRKMKRLPAPDFLEKNWKKWSNTYVKKSKWSGWTTYKGQRVNTLLYPILGSMTASHCTYCDGFPIIGPDSIDHFKPKSRPEFYSLSYHWDNLYLACTHCQSSKKEQYDILLLRPDEFEYEFQRYFEYDYIEQKIKPNLLSSILDQNRAIITIEIFDFNNPKLKKARELVYRHWYLEAAENRSLDDFAYRFIFE